MSELTHNPAFVSYAVCAALLCLNLLGLWLYSGLTRNRTRTLLNPEDTRLLSGRSIVERDPPEVARVLRAHANAMANILPFLVLGFLYVVLGASRTGALAYFGVFTLARYIHSVAYVAALQPWRTVSFVLGLLASVGLLVQVAMRALGGG
jgi:microsomal prostaglandin-E synthase 1